MQTAPKATAGRPAVRLRGAVHGLRSLRERLRRPGGPICDSLDPGSGRHGDSVSGLPARYTSLMRNEFTAIIEQDEEWYVAYCPEVQGPTAGKTLQEARASLAEAITLILEDRRETPCAGCPTTRSAKRSSSGEAKLSTPPPPPTRLRAEAEGSGHSLWTNPNTGAGEAVPRHAEIANRLAEKICRASPSRDREMRKRSPSRSRG